MASIAEEFSNIVYVTSDNPRTESIEDIMRDILVGFKSNKHIVINDRKQAIKEALKKIDKDTILLILGKGHENYQIIGSKKIVHNDLQIIKKIINES